VICFSYSAGIAPSKQEKSPSLKILTNPSFKLNPEKLETSVKNNQSD